MVPRRVHPAVVIQCHQAEDIPQRPDTVNTGDMRNRAVPQRACCHPCQSRSSEASRRPARQGRHSRLEMRFGQAVWVRQCPHGTGLKFRPSGGWTTTTTTTLAGMGTPVAEPHFLHPMAMLGYGLSWSSERKSPPIDSGNSLTTPSMREGSTSAPTKMQPVLAAATAMLLRPLSMGSHTT